MKKINSRRLGATFVAAICGALATAISVAALAQGLPIDWSHRHIIYSNPETEEEAAANGTLHEWRKKADDPRFILQLERKEAKAAEQALAEGADTMGEMNAVPGGRMKALSRKAPAPAWQHIPGRIGKKPTPSGPQIHRDWSNVMGGVGGVGNARNYPAKFGFQADGSKSCLDDFVVFTTGTAGATSTGTVNTRTGTFGGVPAAGGTVTITNVPYNPNQVLILTADASVNTGLKFAVGTSASEAATNLANAIARNGGVVGATATVASAVVTLSSITSAVTNGNFTAATTLSNFGPWGAPTAGSGTAGQPTIFALNQLYADTTNGGCQTPTQAVPAVYWSYNTATPSATFTGSTGTNATISTTPSYGPLSGSPCAAFVASTNPGACDATVGVATVVQNFVAQLQFAIPAATTFRLTVYKNGAPTALTCNITTGKTCSDTTNSVSVKVGDKVAVQVVKVSGTDQPNRAQLFSVDVPLSGPFIAASSPTVSLDGSQVAFMQTANGVATLVLLKWSSTSPGTLGAPTTPTPVTPTEYRGCTAPCMTALPLTGGANDSNSSQYVDYTGDVLYVGDDTGKLHRFSGVFLGTPTRDGTPWPVQVAATSSIMSSPVFDGTNTVYIGSNGPDAATGNKLHRVDATTGGVTSSGAIGSGSDVNGVRDAPILDTTSGKVYAFQGDFASAVTDALGNTCTGGNCNTVFQFASNFAANNTGSFVYVGASGNQNDLNRAMNSGAFDDAYYSSSNATGNLYVCGSLDATARLQTLWKVGISNGSFSVRTRGPQINNANGVDVCSPVTVFTNGSTEFLYASVSAAGSAAGGGGCTAPLTGCIYSYNLNPSPITVFDTTSTSSLATGTNRFFSVLVSGATNPTETAVDTAVAGTNSGTYTGMTINQGAPSPPGTTYAYTLRRNPVGAPVASNTPITCSIGAGGTTCSDTTHAATLDVGDLIDVLVIRTAGATDLTTTYRVQLSTDGSWYGGTTATAALNANGGTGGIIIDNTATGGGSQIYYSTRTSPGIAVQASQAGLQ